MVLHFGKVLKDWINNTLKATGKISPDDTDLIRIADTKEEVVNIIENSTKQKDTLPTFNVVVREGILYVSLHYSPSRYCPEEN